MPFSPKVSEKIIRLCYTELMSEKESTEEPQEETVREKDETPDDKSVIIVGLIVAFLVVIGVLIVLSFLLGDDSDKGETEAPKGVTAELSVVFEDTPGYTRDFVVSCPGDIGCENLETYLKGDPKQSVPRVVLTEDFPPATACTEIYGGPGSVQVQGEINGEPVDIRRTRENGCEIDQFYIWQQVVNPSIQ